MQFAVCMLLPAAHHPCACFVLILLRKMNSSSHGCPCTSTIVKDATVSREGEKHSPHYEGDNGVVKTFSVNYAKEAGGLECKTW
jgi:hypothetical protein